MKIVRLVITLETSEDNLRDLESLEAELASTFEDLHDAGADCVQEVTWDSGIHYEEV